MNVDAFAGHPMNVTTHEQLRELYAAPQEGP
jgi:hypothetical protein